MNNRKKPAKAAALLVAALLLAGCSAVGDSSASTQKEEYVAAVAAQLHIDIPAGAEKVSEEDVDASWDEETVTRIELQGDTATVTGDGAKATADGISITAAGSYLLTGTLDDGQVLVQAPETALVRLILQDASITCTTSAAIDCRQADKLVVVLPEGSENSLTDGEKYNNVDAADDEPDAALFSKVDLSITGTGALSVYAQYNNGIGTKDDLVLASGTLRVNAPAHAIRGRDSVTLLEAELELTAGEDGLQANNSEAGKGWITLYGGKVDITSGNDGIQAESTLEVQGGTVNIVSGGGSANGPEHADEGPMGGNFPDGQPPDGMTPPEGFDTAGMEPPQGGAPPEAPPETATGNAGQNTAATSDAGAATDEAAAETAATEETATVSTKGLKGVGSLVVSGGDITIDSADDALHSNGDVTVSGGTLRLKTGDDAVHADATLLVSGEPSLTVTECYEGLEGATVRVQGGDIHITASDDAVNASADSGEVLVAIEGGKLSLVAGSDVIDSNGDIDISGGTILAQMTSGAPQGGEGILDRDGSMSVTGGTIKGAGGAGIVSMGPAGSQSATEQQPLLELYYTGQQPAGTTVELRDSEGNTIDAFTPEYAFGCVIFSLPDVETGSTVTVYTGGEETLSVTLSGAITAVQDTGAAANTQTGGRGGGRLPQ